MKSFVKMTVIMFVVIASANSEAVAGKKIATLNVAVQESYASVDDVLNPGGEIQVISRVVHDRLITFDTKTGSIVPALAKSWRQLAPDTWEFTLRDDIKFHDGQKLTAQDVAYTLNYLSDPKEKIGFRQRFSWMKSAEVTSANTVIIRTDGPNAAALSQFAVAPAIYPEHAHKPLADKEGYGRAPVGTGPYKVVNVDKNKGVMLERNEFYVHGSNENPAAQIQRVHLFAVPDEQTKIAKMMVQEVDVARILDDRIAGELAKNPNVEISPINSFRFYYITLDAASRSGLRALSDVKVRQAIAYAIDTNAIRSNIIAGGSKALGLSTVCHPIQVGCAAATRPYSYQPQKAKALLASAGHSNGFDLTISTLSDGRAVSEAIAGYLRYIKINATVRVYPVSAYGKELADGKMNAMVSAFTSGGIPDVAQIFGYFFADSPRDYANDAAIKKMIPQAEREFDAQKRNNIYQTMFDRVSEEAFMLPIGSAPTILAHTKEVDLPQEFSTNAFGLFLSTAKWK